jgi:hypothetical protein
VTPMAKHHLAVSPPLGNCVYDAPSQRGCLRWKRPSPGYQDTSAGVSYIGAHVCT